jgi:hypothetical protein
VIDARLAGERSHQPIGGNDADLAEGGTRIGGPGRFEHLGGGGAGSEGVETARPVAGFGEPLAGHHPNSGADERYDRADREEVGLDRDAERPSSAITGDDRQGHLGLRAVVGTSIDNSGASS